MQIQLKTIEYQMKGYLLSQQRWVQKVITDLFTIEQYLQSMDYGSGSSNCYFRFYQQNILGSLNMYISWIKGI